MRCAILWARTPWSRTARTSASVARQPESEACSGPTAAGARDLASEAWVSPWRCLFRITCKAAAVLPLCETMTGGESQGWALMGGGGCVVLDCTSKYFRKTGKAQNLCCTRALCLHWPYLPIGEDRQPACRCQRGVADVGNGKRARSSTVHKINNKYVRRSSCALENCLENCYAFPNPSLLQRAEFTLSSFWGHVGAQAKLEAS